MQKKRKEMDELVAAKNYAGAAAAQEEVKKMEGLVSANGTQGISQSVDAADPAQSKLLECLEEQILSLIHI